MSGLAASLRKGSYFGSQSQIDVPMKFTGHERDLLGSTGTTAHLDSMHARYYNPHLGRFLSVDPVVGEVGSSQSWNRYGYVRNNLLNLVDPTGRADRRTPVDKAITNDRDVMIAVALITERMDLGNKLINDRYEWGTVITDKGGGDYGTEGRNGVSPFTSYRSNEIDFAFTKNRATGELTTIEGQRIVGTLQGHPVSQGVVNSFDRSANSKRARGDKISPGDMKISNSTNSTTYVIVEDTMMLKHESESRKGEEILTGEDYKEYLRTAKELTSSDP